MKKGTMTQHGKGTDRGNKGKGGTKTGIGKTMKAGTWLPKGSGRADCPKSGGKK